MHDTDHKSRLGPVIVSRSEHNVSRANISPNALKVLYRLKSAGYEAFIVGGGVRDLLLERRPKDFDVATNADPDQIQEVFRNCRLIGRRFRLAHVRFGREIVEVATFRASGAQPSFPVGDLNSPLLLPWAKEQMRSYNERVLAGKAAYSRQASCWPIGVPGFLL